MFIVSLFKILLILRKPAGGSKDSRQSLEKKTLINLIPVFLCLRTIRNLKQQIYLQAKIYVLYHLSIFCNCQRNLNSTITSVMRNASSNTYLHLQKENYTKFYTNERHIPFQRPDRLVETLALML
ncbi:unnamed protein product [Acanthoscelides obtectus]|uniref:Uncharacterized protein n=1 Tax=Acanthoscelides obtectus TaxID=200917 RepID=A0A9P0NX55_ACAOB|nr:unnamed protein product [Acanthoscelides obtectus]CAK1637512.1 hypothetical protein AOBTE_LOCUS10012 [Acanthoscelides obtectus]